MAEHAPRLKVLGQTATAHLAIAKGLYQRGLYGQALSELDRILQDNPELPLAHFLKGVILSRLCDYAAAERSLSDAVALDDAMYPAWVGLAFARQEQGQHRHALSAIERGLQVEPKDANGHLMRGTILAALGKKRRAIGAFQDALKYNPQLTLARYKLGRLLAEDGRTDEAIAQIVTAMRLNPLNAEARMALGDVYRSQRKYIEAVREYRAASEIAPQQAEPHARIGEVFLQEGLQQEALAAFRTATRLNPKHVDSFLSIARIYLQQDRDAEALEMVRAAHEADRFYPVTKQLLAEVEARVASQPSMSRESLRDVAAQIVSVEESISGVAAGSTEQSEGSVEDEPRHADQPTDEPYMTPAAPSPQVARPSVDEFELPMLDEPSSKVSEDSLSSNSALDDLLKLPNVEECVAEETDAAPVGPELRFDSAHEPITGPVSEEILLVADKADSSLPLELPKPPTMNLEPPPEMPPLLELPSSELANSELANSETEHGGDPLDVLFEPDSSGEPFPAARAWDDVPPALNDAVAAAQPAADESALRAMEAVVAEQPAVDEAATREESLETESVEEMEFDQPSIEPNVEEFADAAPAEVDYLALAKQQMQAGQSSDALVSVEQALHRAPDAMASRQLKGIILTQVGELDQARDWLKETLRIAPDNESSWLLLARVYEETGQTDSALKCLDRALSLDPRRAATHVALGNILAGLNRTDEAIAAYRTALRYDPALNASRFKIRHHWSGAEQRQPRP